jgi:hypothetical protein
VRIAFDWYSDLTSVEGCQGSSTNGSVVHHRVVGAESSSGARDFVGALAHIATISPPSDPWVRQAGMNRRVSVLKQGEVVIARGIPAGDPTQQACLSEFLGR